MAFSVGGLMLVILSLGLGPGGQGALLIQKGKPPVEGLLDLAMCQRVHTTTHQIFRPAGGMVLPGEDGRWVVAEREAAEMILGILSCPGMRPIYDQMLQGFGRAEVHHQEVLLSVDARTPLLRDIHWEVLEGVPPTSWPVPVRVERASATSSLPMSAPASRIQVLLWTPDLDDSVLTRITRALLTRLGTLPHIEVGWADGASPVEPGVFRVVHVLTHGHSTLNQVTLQISAEGGLLASDSAARVLSQALDGAGLLILDVCSSASTTTEPDLTPAWRLTQREVPMCIAPRLPMPGDAALHFAGAVYLALTQGATVRQAIIAGRRSLAAQGMGYPTWRWWNPTLIHPPMDNSPTVLTLCPLPEGWPSPHPSLNTPLRRAFELANVSGFLGIEHLIQGLVEGGTNTRLTPALLAVLPSLLETSPAFSRGARTQTLVQSPRVMDMASQLSPEVDVEGLSRRLLLTPRVLEVLPRPLHTLILGAAPLSNSATWSPDVHLPPVHVSPTPDRDMTLECLGGPEDGRLLILSSDAPELGRHHPESEGVRGVQLFIHGVEDRGVSRRHLSWVGTGQIQAHAPVWWRRGKHEQALGKGQKLVLEANDLLRLGLGTLLRVLNPGSGDATNGK